MAISYGTMHGASKGKNVKLRKEIAIAIKECMLHEGIFGVLVSHGSSTVPRYIVDEINALGGNIQNAYGISIDELKAAIPCGIGKINVDTDIRLAVTRNMKELYPDSDMPYLSGVACYEDAQAPDYLSVLYLDQEITIEEKDSAGYVTKAQMNGKSYTGEELRGELGLKSANFNVTELEPGKIRIVTKGHGHGFGLSQYTAQKMAEKGEDYRKILQYFFPGAEVKSVE